MARLDGRTALITGGASGIGEATARRFVAEGARVVLADLQEAEGEGLAEKLSPGALFVRCDVTDETDVVAATDAAVDFGGRLDVLFNNAGIVGVTGPIAETPAEAWDATIAVLLRGVFLGLKHGARVMIPRGSGSIISTSSTAGLLGGLGPHVYTAAKHGVIGLTKSVANELASHGIRANAISPGGTATPLVAALVGDHRAVEATRQRLDGTNPLGRATTADDIANAALYLAGDESRSVTGHVLVVDAGVTTAGSTINRFHTGPPALHRQAGRSIDLTASQPTDSQPTESD